MRPLVVATIVCVVALGAHGCAGAEGDQAGRSGRAAAQAERAGGAGGGAASGKESGRGVSHRKVRTRTAIAHGSKVRRTPALRKGDRRVIRQGRDGVRLTVWRVTTRDGETTARRKLRSTVVREPVPQVTLVGTLRTYTRRCDTNYTGGCVPIASDVDCEGGSGDGPAYVAGPVRVAVHDIYGLDADGDGWGCD